MQRRYHEKDNQIFCTVFQYDICICFAILLGAVIIYNMGILSYSEKQYQFATLKVLGILESAILVLLYNFSCNNTCVLFHGVLFQGAISD